MLQKNYVNKIESKAGKPTCTRTFHLSKQFLLHDINKSWAEILGMKKNTMIKAHVVKHPRFLASNML